jgi:hypothetical protein
MLNSGYTRVSLLALRVSYTYFMVLNELNILVILWMFALGSSRI